MEKQCCEKTDVMQLLEYQSQLSSSHIEFPHDLEPLGAYTVNYHPVSLDDQYDGVVNLESSFSFLHQLFPVMDRSIMHKYLPVWEEV